MIKNQSKYLICSKKNNNNKIFAGCFFSIPRARKFLLARRAERISGSKRSACWENEFPNIRLYSKLPKDNFLVDTYLRKIPLSLKLYSTHWTAAFSYTSWTSSVPGGYFAVVEIVFVIKLLMEVFIDYNTEINKTSRNMFDFMMINLMTA